MIAFQVNDMTCGHCAGTITQALKQVDAAAQVSVDLAAKRVEIRSATAGEEALQAAIQEAGYSPKPAAAVPGAAPQRAGGGCCCSR